jgi:uncharacterized protein (DUF1330 family)
MMRPGLRATSSWPVRRCGRQAGFLARGTPVHVLEGTAALRTTVIRFDSADAAVAAYHSGAYQEALAELGDGAERDIRILNEVED